MVARANKKPKAKLLNLDPRSLVLDHGIQPRASTDDGAIDEYSRRYGKGHDLGSLVVFRDPDEGVDRVADGFHRAAGAIAADLKTVRCEVHIGGRSDCLAYALGANLGHQGIRYTNADKRRAVGLALADSVLSGNTDEVVGRLCGVSEKTVTKIRRTTFSSGNSGTDEVQTRTGIDGKQYPVKPRNPSLDNKNERRSNPAELPSDAIEPAPTGHHLRPQEMVDDGTSPGPFGVPREHYDGNGKRWFIQKIRTATGIVIEKYVDPADMPTVTIPEPCPSQAHGMGDAFEGDVEPESDAGYGGGDDDDGPGGPAAPESPDDDEAEGENRPPYAQLIGRGVRRINPDAGEVTVERIAGDGTTSAPAPAPAPAESDDSDDDSALPDEEWLETLPARAGLADYPRRCFDKDAIAYRRQKPAMEAYRKATLRIFAQAKTNGVPPSFVSFTKFWLKSKHPKHWTVCKVCNGQVFVPLVGKCQKCREEGYQR